MNRRPRIHMNIGTVIFGALFIYLVVTFVMFITRSHVDSYQVVYGPLTGNDTCIAMVLRNEDVICSSSSGYVNYFLPNNSKAVKGKLVCGITDSAVPVQSKELTQAEMKDLRKAAYEKSKGFDTNHFDEVYDMQYDLMGVLWNVSEISGQSSSYYVSSRDGIISFSADNYSYMNEREFNTSLFQTANFSIPKLQNQDYVKTGDPLYRIINSEEWAIYFPITDKQTIRLASEGRIRVKFLKDGNTETGSLSFFYVGDQRYGKITLYSGMIRYIDDRFVDVELVTNTEVGLKIPVSSIVSKEFYLIPESLLVEGGEDSNPGFYRQVTDRDGNTTLEFVECTLYSSAHLSDEVGDVYYVDKSNFREGDVLVNRFERIRYTVKETGTLNGVYSINKGYALFRKINVLDQNDEYAIVETNTRYGITLYDYIVRDASSVREESILYSRHSNVNE